MIIRERNDRIKNVITDINNDEIDLRPDFQRGDVWSVTRQKLLIDSIMRNWFIPPIHVVHVDGQPSEVLDGQQRLTAIRDFTLDKFAIDGNIEPNDEEIANLNGYKYSNLPTADKERFDKYLLKIYEITEYNHGEPGELFHRLNQSVKLTSAEQRNAFFGTIRDEVSYLVKHMGELGVDSAIVGFGNSRMAYNDLLVRICVYLEGESIRSVVNDKSLTQRYREKEGFSIKVINSVETSIKFISEIKEKYQESKFSLTKASSFSWMYFVAHQAYIESFHLKEFLEAFFFLESARTSIKNNLKLSAKILNFFDIPEVNLREFLLLYIERSSSRVTAISSISLRDLAIYFACHRAGCSFQAEPRTANLIAGFGAALGEQGIDVKLLVETFSESWKNNES